jgi:hypothetical protein
LVTTKRNISSRFWLGGTSGLPVRFSMISRNYSIIYTILIVVYQMAVWAIHSQTLDHENLMYLPSRMQRSGFLLRIFARLRVCSNTQDFETCNLWASCSGVRMSLGSSRHD